MTRIKQYATDDGSFRQLLPRPPRPPECTCLSYIGDNKDCPAHGEEAAYEQLKSIRTIDAELKTRGELREDDKGLWR